MWRENSILAGNLIWGRKKTIFVAHFLRQNTQFGGKTISNTFFWGESLIFFGENTWFWGKKNWGLFFGGKHPLWGPFFSLCTHCLRVILNFVGGKNNFQVHFAGGSTQFGAHSLGGRSNFGGEMGHTNAPVGKAGAPQHFSWVPKSTHNTPKTPGLPMGTPKHPGDPKTPEAPKSP